MTIEHGEMNDREKANTEAIAKACRDAARQFRMKPHEAWFALLNHASFALAHGCAATTDDEFEAYVTAFVDAARRHWEDHKRDCMPGNKVH